jgi:hypothetical protein
MGQRNVAGGHGFIDQRFIDGRVARDLHSRSLLVSARLTLIDLNALRVAVI